MRRWQLAFLLLAIISMASLKTGPLSATEPGENAGHPSPQSVEPAAPQIIQSDASRLVFTLHTPPATISPQGLVQAAGLEMRAAEPGAPALPYYATYIALPPEAAAVVRVEASRLSHQVVKTVLPAPRPGAGSTGQPAGSRSDDPFSVQPPALTNTPDSLFYQEDAFYPQARYAISEPMYYRDVRLVELRLYPIRYNPAAQRLEQAGQLDVVVQFEGGQLDGLRPSATPDEDTFFALSDAILNFNQAIGWRSLPQKLIATPPTNFPVTAVETYKIELERDGIYEISGADLAAQGMDIDLVDPAAIEMMVRGQPVAYQFLGDSDQVWEANEVIRFYGQAFDGPRAEKQFIRQNVYWLWAGGTPTKITTSANQSGGQVVTSTLSRVTKEPENLFFGTWTDDWEQFPNEPDAWYWDYIEQSTPVLTRTYQITLPHPAAGPDAIYLIELLSRNDPIDPTPFSYLARGYLNDNPSYGQQSWQHIASVNITNTVPAASLLPGVNDVKIELATDLIAGPDILPEIYLNRISVDYWRHLVADGDQLIFEDETGGLREYHVSGFTNNTATDVLVWDVSNPTNPRQITMTASNISGSGSYTYRFGSTGTKFMVTTAANVLDATAVTISRYLPKSLDPPGGGANWIAISHSDFMTPANTLASHRATQAFGGLTTWVVDIEDVINQYGYGLPLPAAIRDYLAFALSSWSPAPEYVTIFGSATLNPRHLDCQHETCPGGLGVWDKDQPTFVVTDLVFKDRFQGLIPTDHTMVLLSGDDLLPDMAIGRITADTAAQAEAAVSKIILYEQNQLTGDAWQKNLLFVADNADSGGNFYAENQVTADNYIPGQFSKKQLYLVDGTQSETDALREAMMVDINGPGAAVLNYRGHGSVTQWASPSIISSDSTSADFWTNFHRPTVILSADCLDGNFAFPGLAALSKTLLTLQRGTTPVGAAAFWSSTGLGYTQEHSTLQRSFYSGLFEQDLKTIGTAINYAKLIYYQNGNHHSEMYSFILQGDPAMQMFAFRYDLFLPVIEK